MTTDCCVKRGLKLGLVAGIIAFAISIISWMVLPWHEGQMHTFKDNKAVAKIITENTNGSGIYAFPCKMKDAKNAIEKPFVFLSVYADGMKMDEMPKTMGLALLIQVISFSLIAMLLSQTAGLGYWCKVKFCAIASLSGGIFVLMNSIFMGFPWEYTGLILIEQVIIAAIAGMFIARFIKTKDDVASCTIN